MQCVGYHLCKRTADEKGPKNVERRLSLRPKFELPVLSHDLVVASVPLS